MPDTNRYMSDSKPRLLVFTTLFPHSGAPNSGVFIRERMFRVGKVLPITVVSPQPWFPGQGLIRLFRPHFRRPAPRHEIQNDIDIFCPRFLSFPGILKRFDGLFMALGSFRVLRRLHRQDRFNLLDAHFGYPDGYAATLLGRWLKVPVTITLRGTELPHSRNLSLRPLLAKALDRATRLFSVSGSLRQHAIGLGISPSKVRVVGNGVDLDKFHPVSKGDARKKFSLPEGARVIISVGALVERKGFHRVIEVLPELIDKFPGLHYLIVGGSSPEGDNRTMLEQQVRSLGLERHVHFLGPIPSSELKWPLSAADLFVLSTGNEGWANVFLEAMAIGLPVITTDVGGNAEVVCRDELGTIVPFGDHRALSSALDKALHKQWNRDAIRAYAEENAWDTRVVILTEEFQSILTCHSSTH